MPARMDQWAAGVHHLFKSRRKLAKSQHRLNKAIIETLETRTMLSITVTSSADDGSTGTLRWAIGQANTAGGDQQIHFASSLTNGSGSTIYLGGTPLELNDQTGTLTIDGTLNDRTRIDAQGQSTAFVIAAGSNAVLKELTISDGNGIYMDGVLNGGAITNNGNLAIAQSVISGNSSSYSGGGIYNLGNLSIDESNISNNSTPFFGGGAYNGKNSSASLTINNSTINGNSAAYGGGVYDGNSGSESLTVSNSTINGNSAECGGGIFDGFGEISISNTTISGNTASFGGGIYGGQSTNISITNSTISQNSATDDGGGFHNDGTAIVVDSTVSGNSSEGNSGGIYSYIQLTLIDSTISGNTAQVEGGISASTLTAIDSTISDNSASYGAGGIASGTAVLQGTIVAGNMASDLQGSFSGDYNLIGDGSGGLSSAASSHNLLGTISSPIDPHLGPLAYYGSGNYGLTQTMPLLPGSPALNSGSAFNDADGNPITTDQRGFSRTQGSAPDIGAFEVQTVTVATAAAASPSSVTGTTTNLSVLGM